MFTNNVIIFSINSEQNTKVVKKIHQEIGSYSLDKVRSKFIHVRIEHNHMLEYVPYLQVDLLHIGEP